MENTPLLQSCFISPGSFFGIEHDKITIQTISCNFGWQWWWNKDAILFRPVIEDSTKERKDEDGFRLNCASATSNLYIVKLKIYQNKTGLNRSQIPTGASHILLRTSHIDPRRKWRQPYGGATYVNCMKLTSLAWRAIPKIPTWPVAKSHISLSKSSLKYIVRINKNLRWRL
jgi:hypothetical protein